MTLILTLWNRDSYNKIYACSPFKVLLFIGLHILICITINASPCTVSPDTCLDSDKPIISIAIGNCTPATFNQSLNTCTGYLSIQAQATDNLTPEELLLFDYKIDLYNDGRGPYNGFDIRVGALSLQQYKAGNNPQLQDNPFAQNNRNPFDASGTYPIGIHKICWYVEDSCGNTAALCQLFEVRDCEAPLPNCQTILKRNFLFTAPTTVYAKDFNYNSSDNCTSKEKLKYYFNGDPAMNSISISCDDFAKYGDCDEANLNLQLWVEDEEGNADYCHVLLKVINDLDPTICCDLSINRSIYGQILASKNGIDSVTSPEVEIHITSSSLDRSHSSNKNFRFSFINPDLYTLHGNRNIDSLNSVSTLDIIKINRHILGLEDFNNPFQKIAADVNHDSIISLADLVEIRNLILGNSISFSGIKNWNVFPVRLNNSILNVYNEEIKIDLNRNSDKYLDLRLVKMGDVNDFSRPLNYTPLIESSDSLLFKYKKQNIRSGDSIQVDFFSIRFTNIQGFQGTFKFDTSLFKYSSFLSNSIKIDTQNLGTKFINKGLLTISWNNPSGFSNSLKENEVAFSIIFNVKQDGDLCDAISFTSDLTPAEAYTDSVLIKKIRLESCDVPLSNHDLFDQNIIVYPNPFNGILHFRIADNLVFPVELSLYDQNGEKIETTKIQSTQSQFSWKLNSIHSGIYFVKITNEQKIIFKKIVKL